MAENPDFILPLRVTLAGSVAGNPFPLDPDGSRDREIGVGSFGHLSGADYTVSTKQAVTIARMKSPRIGTGNVGFPKDILCEVQFTPPIKASARSQRIGRRRAFNARNARKARSLWDFFIGVERLR